MSEHISNCPFCGEPMFSSATFCKYCWKELSQEDGQKVYDQERRQAEVKKKEGPPSKTKWGCLSVIGIVLLIFILAVINNQDGSSSDSEAGRILGRISGELDRTTLEQMMAQIPTSPSSQERRGERRVITWTFSDGSKIVAAFKPLGREGSGLGLVLYSIDIRR